MSIVTSSELLQNILVSINTALQEPDIHNDIRSSLIDQYEKIVSFIREGYQYSEEDLKDLPTTIRAEVQAQLNEEKVALDTSTQTLITTVNDELTQLQALPEAIRTETNTKLNEEITTFQTESQTLTQSVNDELTLLRDERSLDEQRLDNLENRATANELGSLDSNLSLGLQTMQNAEEIGLIKSKIGVK